MEVIELEGVTSEQWREVIGEEPEPWGVIGEELVWRDKTHHVGVRNPAGRLVAMAGLVCSEVAVTGDGTFPIVGIGGVIVAREERGRGLARRMIGRLLQLAARLGPERAMLFCRPELVEMYSRFGFLEIDAPVAASQPDGRVEVPMAAMWRPLADGVGWPPGAVEVHGLPF